MIACRLESNVYPSRYGTGAEVSITAINSGDKWVAGISPTHAWVNTGVASEDEQILSGYVETNILETGVLP